MSDIFSPCHILLVAKQEVLPLSSVTDYTKAWMWEMISYLKPEKWFLRTTSHLYLNFVISPWNKPCSFWQARLSILYVILAALGSLLLLGVGLLLLPQVGSCRVMTSISGGFSCFEAQARPGSVVVAHAISAPEACRIFLTRDWTRIPWDGRQILNHWNIRDTPQATTDAVIFTYNPGSQ